jgi:DNA-directed RNA polymerase specialized sigma24 family protein
MDDQTILDLIRTGKNDLALNALYRNFPSVRKLIRSKGGSAKDAEDTFQEALLILLQNIQKDFHLSAQLSTSHA